MSKQIIQPMGRIVRRIVVEVDVRGQTRVDAKEFSLTGNAAAPMGGIEVVTILAQVVSTNLVAFMGSLEQRARLDQDAGKNQEKGNDGIPGR